MLVVEMMWECTYCHQASRGRFKTCENCKAPRHAEAKEWIAKDTPVQDTKLLKKFKAGKDWTCPYCMTEQFRADQVCTSCGADFSLADPQKKATSHTPKKKQESAYRSNARPAEQQHKERRSVAPTVTDWPKKPLPPLQLRWKCPTWVLVAAGSIALIGLALFLGFREQSYTTTVTAVHWVRTTNVERYARRYYEGWSPDFDAEDIRSEGQRIHHYDHVLVGYHSETYQESYSCGQDCTTPACYTTPRNCTSNKNGSATCTGGDTICPPRTCTPRTCYRPATRQVADYEDQPRYQTWYSWYSWRWGFQRAVKVEGFDSDPYWPSDSSVALNQSTTRGETERVSGQVETYEVFMASGDKAFTYKPTSESVFKQFPIGSKHRIKYSILMGVRPITSE
jgi:hypothetical protein